MEVKIELPEDIKRRLERDWGDVSQHALEGLAIEGYRAGVLSRAQVRRMLGFETRTEVDEFMARHGVPFDYTVEDFERDAETGRHLREIRSKELARR
jgi:predicted HTH domain antitoxin